MASAHRDRPQMLEFALQYAVRGWRVHPVHGINKAEKCTCGKVDCPPKHQGKHPLLFEWQHKATTNSLEIVAMWDRWPFANVALATGAESDLVVLDVDPDTGGFESLRKLENDVGKLPETITARSGSGGFHFYFHHPGVRIQNRNPIPNYPGLDIRGDGGYIMAPPSKHRSGNVYRWQESDNDLAHMPTDFVTFLLSIGASDRPKDAPPRRESTGKRDPSRWLQKAILKATPGNRNATGLWLACQLRDNGVEHAEAEYLMLQYAASVSTHDDPYTDREALASLRQAYKHAPREEARSQSGSSDRAPPPPRTEEAETEPAPEDNSLTDTGNAQRLYKRHGTNLRYVYEWKSWVVWAGTHWQRDNGDLIMTCAIETARSIIAEAQVEDKEKAKEIFKWAMRSRNKKALDAMIATAQHLCVAVPADFDQDNFLWNSPNGTTDLRTGELREHRREDMITKLSPVPRRPDASCPLWLANLRRFMAEDMEMVSYLQRLAGYVLTGDVSERSLEIAYGPGSNFKGTFFDTLHNIWGQYARAIATDTLMVTKYDRTGPEMAELPGVRLAIASEGEDGQALAVARVKRMTGGINERITAEAKFERPFEFVPTHKTILMTNKLPTIRDTTNSIWNRVHLQPWTVVIPPEEIDLRFPERLEAEYSGILEWAIQGCLIWQHGGLRPPETVLQATTTYRGDMNIVAQFIEAKCEIGKAYEEKSEPLYLAFKLWCEEHGERVPRVNDFAQRMKENGWKVHKTKHANVWYGLRLRRLEANEQDSMFRDNG